MGRNTLRLTVDASQHAGITEPVGISNYRTNNQRIIYYRINNYKT